MRRFLLKHEVYKYNNNNQNIKNGPAKTSLNSEQGFVKANPCWSRGRSVQSFARNFFLLNCCQWLSRYPETRGIQDAYRLTLFLSRPLFSLRKNANPHNPTCLVRRPSPSPLETCAPAPVCNFERQVIGVTFGEKGKPRRDIRPTNFACSLCLIPLRLSLRTSLISSLRQRPPLSRSLHTAWDWDLWSRRWWLVGH